MNTLEKAISGRLEKYLHAVRAVLENNGVEQEEITDLLDNLRCHALETASRHLESMSLEDALSRTLASLEAPDTYASYIPQPLNTEEKAIRNYSGWLGITSALTMILALLLAAVLSQHKLFDTPTSGTIFVFGEMLALGTGVAAWPNIWAKAGALCSALLLAFLMVAFLWVTASAVALWK
jgi:hypothetical protein